MEDKKIKSPHGEEFEVVSSGTVIRILNEGVPFIASGVEVRKLVVKEGEVFFYTDYEGSVPRNNPFGLGLYYKDTRFLSTFEVYVQGKKPLLLTSSAELDYRAFIELTNPDMTDLGGVSVPQETINIRRLRSVKDNLYEQIRVKNYNLFPIQIELQLLVGADFFDLFEVRGLRRFKRGQILKPKYDGRALSLAYIGLDDVFRSTRIEFLNRPERVDTGPEGARIAYAMTLEPHETKLISLVFKPIIGTERKRTLSFNTVAAQLRESYHDWDASSVAIETDNAMFNAMVDRGAKDIRQLLTETSDGTMMAAGVPWFVAPFGRDSIITAFQTLMLNTVPAYETAKMLAALQGSAVDGWRDEEPGKILHEVRKGELTNLGEVPHTPYYGTIDATPLFLIMMGLLFKWTGDEEFMNAMLEPMDKALQWIDEYGDSDGDLFLEYKRKSPRGLIHQGWKDSGGAICYKDATPAVPPIALCEVQGYVHLAKKTIADVYAFLGYEEKAKQLKMEAKALKDRFNEVYWMQSERCFALALDRDKRQVNAVSSNAGQCLFGGIADKTKARQLVARLMQPDIFSGWGIRTLSKSSANFNPMAYHNGSIWPHDNSLIAYGLKRYGFKEEAVRIATNLYEAAMTFDDQRLPELFCGFSRRVPHPPVQYPVSCAPQAWAAGSVFLIIQFLLGLEPDAPKQELSIIDPVLPDWLNTVTLRNLRVGKATVDLRFQRRGEQVEYEVLSQNGTLDIRRVNEG